jgi:hypothetical protein
MYQRALQGMEKAWGPEHTSTFSTVNNLGILYAGQGKLVGAEQMYQQALQGYEEVLGSDNIITYIPALNTILNLASLYKRQADIAKTRIMYSKALIGYRKVFGPNHPESRGLRENLSALDAVVENRSLIGVEEPVDDL